MTGSTLPTERRAGGKGRTSKPTMREGRLNEPGAQGRHSSRRGRRLRILIVEDESDLSLLLGYNLEAEGHVVENVERGDEAELRAGGERPDLVILDWMLPGVSGPRNLPTLTARERPARFR